MTKKPFISQSTIDSIRKLEEQDAYEASIPGLIEKRDRLKAEREALFEQIAPLQKKVVKLYDQIEALNDQIGQKQVEELKGLPTDWTRVLDGDLLDSANRKWAEDKLLELGFYVAGTYELTRQRCLKVMVNYRDYDSVEKIATSIETILPYLKPLPENRYFDVGWTMFSIFEHTLSRYGSYYLLVEPQTTKAKVVNHRGSEYFEGDLRQTLRYVADMLWYEGGPEEDD